MTGNSGGPFPASIYSYYPFIHIISSFVKTPNQIFSEITAILGISFRLTCLHFSLVQLLLPMVKLNGTNFNRIQDIALLLIKLCLVPKISKCSLSWVSPVFRTGLKYHIELKNWIISVSASQK